MAAAGNFCSRLATTLNNITRGYEWKTEVSLDEHSKVDVAGLKHGKLRVLIEVELKKDNPVENVVKIWRWATKHRPTHALLVFQAFSDHYNPAAAHASKLKQYERACFIGLRMKSDAKLKLRYHCLQIIGTTRSGRPQPYRPLMRHGITVTAGGAAMLRAAEELAKSIAELLPSQ